MAKSITELLAQVHSASAPDTQEFAASFAEIQQELKTGPKPSAYTVRRISDAEARLMLTAVLRHLEKQDLPKMIADAELLRQQLGMPSMLFKRLGDCLKDRP